MRNRQALVFAGLFLGSACAGGAPPPKPEQLPFAAAYLEPSTSKPTRATEDRADDTKQEVPTAPPLKTRTDEIRGLVTLQPARIEELRRVASSEQALTELLLRPVSREDLEALAWLRSPVVQAARARVEAARTAYAQSADLKDLVALYRSFSRNTETRVGPEKSRLATDRLAPSPNIEALSGEIVQKTVAIAFENLRRTIRDTVAAAEKAHADAARLRAARRILKADVDLHESLVSVVRVRFEAGGATQAGLLAFQSRLESSRTELSILGEEEAAVRARWNRLLDRPYNAAALLDVLPSGPVPGASGPDAAAVVANAQAQNEEYRSAALAAARSALAVRLAETMTLPRFDLGSSRFERERAGEAGVQRRTVFPEPGRMLAPRADFGVREAQVSEMRARKRATDRDRDASRDETQTRAREALFALDAARRRWLLYENEVVPLAQRSFESARGAYEGNRTGYIELLDRARALLAARLGRVDARRAHAHADAGLLRAVGVRMQLNGDKR
ncbi:MAG: TolC family protein [Planctomycetota bacterium]|nr:TolC family protein [Planctomycetota bacterium]